MDWRNPEDINNLAKQFTTRKGNIFVGELRILEEDFPALNPSDVRELRHRFLRWVRSNHIAADMHFGIFNSSAWYMHLATTSSNEGKPYADIYLRKNGELLTHRGAHWGQATLRDFIEVIVRLIDRTNIPWAIV